MIGCLNVADICNTRGIHLTFYSTGCIFYYDEAHAMGSGIGFTEEDKPNFTGSFYSETKVSVGVELDVSVYIMVGDNGLCLDVFWLLFEQNTCVQVDSVQP